MPARDIRYIALCRFIISIFYYIDLLYDNNPQSVVDVGCGECLWKNWFPNIVGFDPSPCIPYSKHDFVDFFDNDFSKGHTENWDCGLALNSIHFISWQEVPQQIKLAMNIIRKGGRFLFTFNLRHFDTRSHDDPIALLNPKNKIKHLYELIQNLGYKILVFDSLLLQGVSEKDIYNYAFINGDVRFILEK